MYPPAPSLEYRLAPCPGCGARNVEEAATMCRPASDPTGEVYCVAEFDCKGRSIQPTDASLAALDAWCDGHPDNT